MCPLCPLWQGFYSMKTIKTDILILGSGGAGLFAALHAHQHNPELSITIAVKKFKP